MISGKLYLTTVCSLSLGGVALRVVRKWLYDLFTGSLYVPVCLPKNSRWHFFGLMGPQVTIKKTGHASK